jgi:DNA replication protein DnaC
MNAPDLVDAARLGLLLGDLRLPAIKHIWPGFAERADREGWPAARFLAALAEHEIAERARRRIERHLAEARLPPGKSLDAFDFDAVPMISKAQVMALVAGDSWLEKGDNLLVFGPPGGGKSHLAAAIGPGLVENGWRVLFTRTTDLVQRLQVARRELALESAIAKLDKYHLLILDDLAYVTKDQAETSVLFELISARYERRSVLITANQPFGEWNRIFPDPAMTLAARRPARRPRDDLRAQRRTLPAPHCRRAPKGAGPPAKPRDNQDLPRMTLRDNQDAKSLARGVRRREAPPAATPSLLILIVALKSSRSSRYTQPSSEASRTDSKGRVRRGRRSGGCTDHRGLPPDC